MSMPVVPMRELLAACAAAEAVSLPPGVPEVEEDAESVEMEEAA